MRRIPNLFSGSIWQRFGLAPTFTLAEVPYLPTEPSNSARPAAKPGGLLG